MTKHESGVITCDWDGNRVRGRYATFILPDGTVKHTHGKCRWFPEFWRQEGIHDLHPKITMGPKGEIIDFSG